MAAARPT